MRIRNVIGALLLAMFVSSNASAQDVNREVGLRGTGINNYGLIYKFEKEPGVYRRYRAASASLLLDFRSELASSTFGIYTAKEKRKDISDKLTFSRGWEWGVSTSLYLINQDGAAVLSPSLGYILGAQYQVNKDLSVGLEVVPTLRVNYIARSVSAGGSFGTSSSFINFTVAHTFASPAKKKK